MGATDLPRRRFITRAAVEDTARAGGSITLGPRDVLTDEAATRARDLGVTIVRPGRPVPGASRAAVGSSAPSPVAGGAGSAVAAAPASAPGSAVAPAPAPGALRATLRAAVVAELGTEDPRLDTVIDTVLARRGLT